MSTKQALVLSGGDIKGAFQAGAIAQVLSEKPDFQPSILVGTSIGAINAAFLADRAGREQRKGKPPVWGELGAALETFWLDTITSPDRIIEVKGTLGILLDIWRKKFTGFVGIDHAIQLIRQEVSLENVRAAKLEVQVATVDVKTGNPFYGCPDQNEFVDYVIASSAMPLIMPLIHVSGSSFTDGGIREVAPLRKAIDLGADEVICIVCQAEKLDPESFDEKDLFPLAGRLMEIVTNELVTDDLRQLRRESALRAQLLEAKKQPVTRAVTPRIIRPKHDFKVDLKTFTKTDIVTMIVAGHEAAKGVRSVVVDPLTIE